MSTTTPLTDSINALTTYANEVTGASDSDLSSAVATLIAGYGGGGSDEDFVDTAMATITRIDNSDITSARESAFSDCKRLTYVNLPNLTSASHYIFRRDNALTEIHVPKLQSVGNDAFNLCTNLVTFDAPLLESVGSGCFANAPLTNLNILPKLKTIGGSITFRNAKFTVFALPALVTAKTNLFLNCTDLITVDFGTGLASIPAQMLNGNTSLANIILRNTTAVTLANTNGLWGNANEPSVHPTIYVPSSLISTYQSASNWSTLYNAGYITFSAIEGTQYENYYADGTPIS